MSATTATKNINILFFGPPGAGKGTQAEALEVRFRLAQVSTGDLFRYHIREQTPLGVRVKAILDSGGYVPDDVTIAMLEEHLRGLNAVQPDLRGIIFDGFPRTVPQVVALDNFLAGRGEQLDAVILLEVPRESLFARLISRGRPDDKPDVVARRQAKYEDETAPLIVEYEPRGIVHHVNGDQSVDAVTREIVAALSPLFGGV